MDKPFSLQSWVKFWVDSFFYDHPLGICLTDEEIKNTIKTNFKKILKENILISAFKYLQSLKINHSKVKMIEYDKLELQPYITSNKLSTDEKQLQIYRG